MVHALALLTFAHPGLLLGLGAALLPLLVHLLLRPRPRRTRFPAISLLRNAFASGQRANRLHNLVVLILRAALVMLAALLLAGPTCTPPVSSFVGTQPVACVVVLDDSASASYRSDDGTSLLEQTRREALDLVQDSAAWPAGSALTVLSAGLREPQLPWTRNTTDLAEALQEIGRRPPHARPLGAALRAAADRLRSADQPARRLVVFTDGTAQAWADATPAILSGLPNMGVRVVMPAERERTNLAVLSATGPAHLFPATAAVPVQAGVFAQGVSGEFSLAARVEGRTLDRAGPVSIAANASHESDLSVPALAPGPHGLTVSLDPPDRMNFDQQRYVAVQTAPRPLAWLVTPTPKSGSDASTVILQNALAPQALPADQQRVELHTIAASGIAASLAALQPGERPTFAIVVAGEAGSEDEDSPLVPLLERGTTVLLVPGSASGEVDWPGLRSRLCASAPTDETLTALTGLHWETTSAYAGMDDLAELTRCVVHRRLRLAGLLDGVSVEARYGDGVPAIVSRRVGRGRLLALSTTPDPQWSDLGIRAAGLMTWLHQLVDEAAGEPNAIGSFTLGEVTRSRFAVLPAAGPVRVVLEDADQATPVWLRLSDGVPEKPWPTDRPGIYDISATGENRPGAVYVVNFPADESRLDPIEPPALRALLGIEDLTVTTAAAGSNASGAKSGQRWFGVELRQLLGALLLSVFAVELWLTSAKKRAPWWRDPATGPGRGTRQLPP